MSDALRRWDATALAAAIRTREISSREAVSACIARMHEVNPALNAVTCDLSEEAITEAAHTDAAVARGAPLEPLQGVPVTIKENVDQVGCAIVSGVAAFRGGGNHAARAW